MEKLISFTIKAEKGFFKKPDINEGIYLTFNILHKPALLGILGAIIGLSGYKKNEEFPEYYKILKDIPVGIEPINHEKGNFQKTVITYTNTTGFASHEAGGNLIISEQTLIKPSYKIFLLLNLDDEYQEKLFNYIKEQKAEYLPYMGKNDYSLWWNKSEVVEYEWEKIDKFESSSKITTLFIKKIPFINLKKENENFDLLDFSLLSEEPEFAYFEKLPIYFDEKLYQYKYEDFVYTNSKIKTNILLYNIYKLKDKKGEYSFVQLF